MGVFKASFLESYLSESHKLKTPDSEKDLLEKFLNLDFLGDIRQKYSNIIDPSLKNLKSIEEIPIGENLGKIPSLFNQYPIFKSLLMDVLKVTHNNILEMWKTFYYYDEFLFQKFTKMMKSENIPEDILYNIIVEFQKERVRDLSLLQKNRSILDISNVEVEASFKVKEGKFTFGDLDSKRWDIFQILNQKPIEDQELRVHNWCKEFGDLIETQFKRTIYFIFQINFLIEKKKKYHPFISHKSLSVNNIFKKFMRIQNYDNSYPNISTIHHLRNAINHGNFEWKGSSSIENSIIQFTDEHWTKIKILSWNKTLTFDQLLVQYFKILTFIATFELIVMVTQLSLPDRSKKEDEILKEFGSQLFQIISKNIKNWLGID